MTGKYRRLSKDEWTYLFNTRTASNRFVKTTVNNQTGMILLPDSYTHPLGVPALTSINSTDAEYVVNNYTGTDWKAMESAGAVFLPTAGYRDYGYSVRLITESK